MSWQQPQQPPYPPQGQPPQGQFPQGQFPPGQYPYPPARPSQALAIVALVTGILSLLLISLIGPFAIALGVAGIVTGSIALSKRLPGRGMALAGLITGAVGVVVTIVVTALVVAFYGGIFLFGALDEGGSWNEDGLGYSDDYGYGDEYGGGYSAGDHAFGEQVALDEYAVSVDDVQVRGDVVFADLTVQFTGAGTGDSYEDLYGYLYDVDGYEYAATDCYETLTPDAADLPDLASGETVTFQMCFDGVTDAGGAWVTVVDDEGYGTSANWTDELTLEGSSNTGV